MKNSQVIASILLAAVVLLWVGNFAWHHLRGESPAILPPPANLARQIPDLHPPMLGPALDPAFIPLKLPQGFSISIFATHVPGARVLCLDPAGTLLVSLTRQGRVVALPDKDGEA